MKKVRFLLCTMAVGVFLVGCGNSKSEGATLDSITRGIKLCVLNGTWIGRLEDEYYVKLVLDIDIKKNILSTSGYVDGYEDELAEDFNLVVNNDFTTMTILPIENGYNSDEPVNISILFDKELLALEYEGVKFYREEFRSN